MKKTSTENVTKPTKHVAKNIRLIDEGNSTNHAKKDRKLFTRCVVLYRESLSLLRFWLIKWSPTLFFSCIYKPYYVFASAFIRITSKTMGATRIETRGSFAKKNDPNFVPLLSDIDINIFFDHINRNKLYALDLFAACFPFLSIHIQHNKSYALITTLFQRLGMKDILRIDWKGWRILTKTFPNFFSKKRLHHKIILNASLLLDANMTPATINQIINRRDNFHDIRKRTYSPETISRDWSHILRSIPPNSNLETTLPWDESLIGLNEIHFTENELQIISEVFPLGVLAVLIDYHPWRYRDKHVIWVINDAAETGIVDRIIKLIPKNTLSPSNYYVSYPSPIIICEKHLTNSYLPKMAYLPRYKIKSDLTIELERPTIRLGPLCADVMYETTILLTDIWKMSRDHFARGRINDLVDGLIPGLLLLLNRNEFVGNIKDIQKRFSELYPNHPIWELQREVRKEKPNIKNVQESYPAVLEELRKAFVQIRS